MAGIAVQTLFTAWVPVDTAGFKSGLALIALSYACSAVECCVNVSLPAHPLHQRS